MPVAFTKPRAGSLPIEPDPNGGDDSVPVVGGCHLRHHSGRGLGTGGLSGCVWGDQNLFWPVV